jgi:kynureninase
MAVLRHAVEREWGERLVRGWNDGWIYLPDLLGDKIAQLIGARPGEVLVTEATSINLFKLVAAALRARPGRTKIVSDVFNFPSDLYIMQGIIDMLGGRHSLELVPSRDDITIDPQDVEAAIDQDTALVCLTHVAYRSAFMHDMRRITEQAHRMGALALWDLCHSVGAVPLDLTGCHVDLAVGCTYKYLNSGPGAPAFLYVRRDLQDQLVQPIWGWFADKDPFAFNLDFAAAPGLSRFRVGSIPILAMKTIEPALDIMLEAGMQRLRAKNLRQTEYLIFLADRWLAPLGFSLGSPLQAERRGAHISLRHPEGYRIARAMIETPPPTLRVIPDFRPPQNIRLGVASIYNTYTDIYRALERMKIIVANKEYENYPHEKLVVT